MSDEIKNTCGLSKQTIKNLEEMEFCCQRCSNCCRHDEGYVFLTKQNVYAIADHLKMSVKQFISECCRVVEQPEGNMLCLKEKQNYDCIFWSNGCLIYEVRPTQCMTYPYWPFIVNNKELQKQEKKRCKGFDKKGNHSLEYKIQMYQLEQDSDYYMVENNQK